ncbi:MAG: universal stress protein [Pseudomonadota bacterium]
MRFASILTVLDKPKHKQSALLRAARLQQLGGGNLQLVSFYWNAMLDADHTLSAEQRRKLRHELGEKLKKWQRERVLREIDDEHRTQVRLRSVWSKELARWVAEEVDKNPVDLVVKSLHKSKTLMYTPTDWQLLRNCAAPVLLTTNKSKKARNNPGPVLAALDFKHTDAKHRRLNSKVLQTANDYAELISAPLHIVFAIETSQVLRDLDITDAQISKQKVLQKIQPALERTLAAYPISKGKMHFPVGKAGQVVNQKARTLGCDVVVVGSTVHKIQQSLGLGNTAERILTRATTDVLVVKP